MALVMQIKRNQILYDLALKKKEFLLHFLYLMECSKSFTNLEQYHQNFEERKNILIALQKTDQSIEIFETQNNILLEQDQNKIYKEIQKILPMILNATKENEQRFLLFKKKLIQERKELFKANQVNRYLKSMYIK